MIVKREHAWMTVAPGAAGVNRPAKLRVAVSRVARVLVALVPLYSYGNVYPAGTQVPTDAPQDENRAFVLRGRVEELAPYGVGSFSFNGADWGGVLYSGVLASVLEIDFTLTLTGTQRDVSAMLDAATLAPANYGSKGSAWGVVVVAEWTDGREGDLVTSCEAGRVEFNQVCVSCG